MNSAAGAAPAEQPCTIIWDGIHVHADRAAPAHVIPVPLREILADLRQALTGSPPGPVMVKVDRYRLHGHALGDAGRLVCGFPNDNTAAYRSYARGLNLLTEGRLRLVMHRTLQEQLTSVQPILQGPVDTLPAASLLLTRFRELITELVPPRLVRLRELVFTELAENTYRYGSLGRMAVYRDSCGISILAEDQGSGIPLHLLPSSLLVSGYSTNARSLGAGYPTILRLAESTTLATGEQGTAVLVRLKSASSEVN